MSRPPIWDHRALFVWRRLPLHIARKIDAAVIRLGDTGQGDLVAEGPHLVLLVGRYGVVLDVHPVTERVIVFAIFRAR